MEKRELIAIRGLEKTDEAFVFTTWLKGLRYSNSWFEQIDQATYFKNYHKVVEALLARSNTSIACLIDDPDIILGYSVVESPGTLHWVFVKPDWRRIGLAKDLIPQGINTVSHITTLGLQIKPKSWIFNPFHERT